MDNSVVLSVGDTFHLRRGKDRIVYAGMPSEKVYSIAQRKQEFVLNAGKVLTHTHLLNKVWGPEYREEREYLHVFVRRLRAKLEPDPTNPRYITTVPGVGYQFKDTA